MPEFAHEYPAVQPADDRFRAAWVLYLAGAVPRHRQGPRRRPFAARHARRARASAAQHGLSRGGHRAGRVPGRAPPDHVGDRRRSRICPIPTSSRAFAERVGNERRLIALYLLTVADIRGTSPKVWNAWKAQAARGPVPRDAARARAATRRAATQDARRASRPRRCGCCGSTRCPTASKSTLWAQLDTPTSCATTPQEIAWHTRHLLLPRRHRPRRW